MGQHAAAAESCLLGIEAEERTDETKWQERRKERNVSAAHMYKTARQLLKYAKCVLEASEWLAEQGMFSDARDLLLQIFTDEPKHETDEVCEAKKLILGRLFDIEELAVSRGEEDFFGESRGAREEILLEWARCVVLSSAQTADFSQVIERLLSAGVQPASERPVELFVLVCLCMIVQGDLDNVSQTVTRFIVKRGDAVSSSSPHYRTVKRVTSACKTQQAEMLDSVIAEFQSDPVTLKLLHAAKKLYCVSE